MGHLNNETKTHIIMFRIIQTRNTRKHTSNSMKHNGEFPLRSICSGGRWKKKTDAHAQTHNDA